VLVDWQLQCGGQYLVGTSTYEGFFINEVKGTWQSATEMALPRERRWPGEMAASSRCRAARPANCSAGAAYLDASSEYQALVINEVGGQWEAGLKITLPTGNNTVASTAASTD